MPQTADSCSSRVYVYAYDIVRLDCLDQERMLVLPHFNKIIL